MVGHSGYYGCSYCLHPGIPVKGDKKSVVRFVTGSTDYELRSNAQTLAIYKQLKSTPIKGVKSKSCMMAAHVFDVINSFAIDSMHGLHSGITDKTFSLWIDIKNKNKPYYMSKKKQVELSHRLVSIKTISDIIRKPKSIFVKGDFKANERRSMLLFYLPMALDGLIHSKYIEHFRLLSSASYILSKTKITQEEIEVARSRLKKFVKSYEILYGRDMVTMNTHLAIHMAPNVENLGPMWANSAYPFEANNGLITKANNTTNDSVLHQLAWKYVMRETIKSKREEDKVCEFSMNGKKTIKITSIEKELIAAKISNYSPKDFLNIHKSVCSRGIKFTSLESKDISTIDYFVRLKNENIASIRFYVVFDSDLYALIDIYEVVSQIDHFTQIKCSQVKELIKFNDILEKMLYLKFGRNEYVTTLPNKYEKT